MAYVRVQRSRRFERGLFDLRLRAEAAQAAPDVTPDLDEGIALEIRMRSGLSV